MSEQLEEYLSKLKQSGMRKMNFGSAGVVIVLVIVIAAAATSVYSVQTDGQAVIKRFGRVVSIKPPGLHFKLPFGIDRATFIPTERVLKEEFGFRTVQPGRQTQYSKNRSTETESLMLTGDLNVIDVEWVVQYRIIDPVNFMHQVREPVDSIRDISEAVMRRIVGNRLGSDVLTVGRVTIAAEVKSELQQILDTYKMGVSIERIELQDVTPPESVKPAFNEVNEARQQLERLINEAEKKRNQVIPRARGEADQTIAEAEAYRAERVNQAKGEAARFNEMVTAYRQAPDITRQRLYIEMMNEVLPTVKQLYVVDESVKGILPLLNLTAPGEAR
ncbi:MAG: FtsH protease activity modulator HflK [Kiritimatiellales bacterium]|nr:FtsH protease activity modulator HflK [Kiritimatiellota bacterium]MBL7011427.1 FtsH protease activity modulator HflK [Kiritimatiellales bacterium]